MGWSLSSELVVNFIGIGGQFESEYAVIEPQDKIVGKKDDESTLQVFSSSNIGASSIIKSNGKVVFSSSGEVTLKKGFEVKKGGKFSIEPKIHPYQKQK